MIVDHLGITVDDLPRASAQFGAVLGALGFARSDGDGAVFWWRAGEPELILYGPRERGHHVHGRVGWQHLALEVGSRVEVDRIHGVAVAAGWTVDYQEWQAAAGPWPEMPRRLQAVREGARVRLVVDGWEAGR